MRLPTRCALVPALLVALAMLAGADRHAASAAGPDAPKGPDRIADVDLMPMPIPVAVSDGALDEPVHVARAPEDGSAPDVIQAPGPFGRRLLSLPFLPLDSRIMLVMDGSNSMEGRLNLETKKAARRLLALLDIRRNANVEVGVVHFDNRARTGCRLMRDERRLIGCIHQSRSRLGTNIVAGLRQAMKELVIQRESPGIPAAETEMVVLLTDGLHRGRCDDVVDEAHSVKANGIRMIVVTVGPRADTECMADIVATPNDLYQIATHVRLGE